MNSNDSTNQDLQIQVGKLRPLEIVLKSAFLESIDDIAAGKMTCAEVVGILEEVKLITLGVFEE